jgi:hypothetical protein
MMRHVAIFAVLFVASALALASLMIVWSTHGSGVARNDAGRMAHFRVEASKKVHGTLAPQIGGTVVLEFPSTTNVAGERISMHVHEYEQDGNKSRMAGPAVWRRLTPAGWQEVNGLAHASFTSNRHPEENAPHPDTLEIHFSSATSNLKFNFGGAVIRGDVTVAKTESY